MENQNTAQATSPMGPDTTTAPQAEAPQLTIVDLQNLRAIVDTASRRGAFGAAELTSVGATFDRLNIFLNSVAPGQADTTQQAPSA
jgi:hypothetical protein